MASPKSAGVLGIARTTGTSPKAASNTCVGTPAASERIT